MAISRRETLLAAAAFAAGCAPHSEETPREGRVSVPGGNVVWRRFGGGAKIPVLAIHGGPGFPSDYIETLGAIGEERSVYFWDQLGCGRSDRPTDPALWQIPRFVEEVHAVRAALGLDRVHLVGQSWGTCLSVEYLLAKGLEGVASVTLAGPVMSASRYIAEVTQMIRALSPQHQAAIARAEASGDFQTPDYAAATEAFYALHIVRHPTAETQVLWERALAGVGQDCYVAMNGPSEFSITGSLRTFDRMADLGRLERPVLYLCGEFDTCTPAASRAYADATPNAEVTIIADAGHCTTIDAPEETNAAVRAFIEAHDA